MRKWLLLLALLIFGYYLNVKIKQWSENSILKNVTHLDRYEEETPPPSIPTKVIPPPVEKPVVNQEPQEYNPPPTKRESPSYQREEPRVQEPVADPNQWKRDVSGNTLVSCQTQIQYCEPQQDQQYQDGSINTFCITFARNCTNVDSIQRTWEDHEVFKPAPMEPDNNNPTYQDNGNQDYSQQPYDDYQQNQYDSNQYPNDPTYPVDPSTYLPPMPYAEPPQPNHEVVDPAPQDSEY